MPHAVRVTKGPSTSVMTEAEEEASHDETSTHEESEPQQEVSISHPHPNAQQPVYTNMYMPYIKGPKMDWMVNNALYHRFLKTLNVRTFLSVSSQPSLNTGSARKLSLDLATLVWISMYPGGYPKPK